jgi:polygalacturonase
MKLLKISLLALLAATSCRSFADAPVDVWAQVPAILARIVPPKFPNRDFDVTQFGARGDGSNDCTLAFSNAIAACHNAGGGRVIVPPGKFLTGAIHLKSGVNFHVTQDATILFSTDPKKFLPPVFSRDLAEMMNYSPFIYALGQTNIAITGNGTLDGQASKSVWPQWAKKSKDGASAASASGDALQKMGDAELPVAQRVMGEGQFIRPCFVEPARCRNVLIEGVTVRDSANWVLHPLYCTNVTVRGVKVDSHGANNDGCDPDSSTDVLIKDCTFDTGDDCIAIKAGRDHDGRRVNLPSQNIVIQNCTFKDGHGGVTLGSETSGGIRHVFAEDCHFDSPDLDQALRFKSSPARGGFIRDIFIRHCRVKTARFGINMTLKYSAVGTSEGEFIPVVRDLEIRDCVFEKLLKQAVFIQGHSEKSQITDVLVTGCEFPTNSTATITNAARIRFVNNRGLPGE